MLTNHNYTNQSKRTILYYPDISIPPGRWLRQALFYWDEIGSIVPQTIKYKHDIQYLLEEGEFRPFRPDKLIQESRDPLEKFQQEFKSIVNSSAFQNTLDPNDQRQLDSSIHCDKVSHTLFHFLEDQELAKRDKQNSDWYLFEKRTALLYMGLLAQYLADIDTQAYTVTGTDCQKYEKLLYDASPKIDCFTCLNTIFRNVLPIPRNDVPLADIVEFKRKRRDELLHFRQQIDSFQQRLSAAKDMNEVKYFTTEFKESIEREFNILSHILNSDGVSIVASSFKALINMKSPVVLGAGAMMFGKAAKITEIPVEWMPVGFITLGIIQIACHMVDRRNEKRAALRSNSFSYLYYYDQSMLKRKV